MRNETIRDFQRLSSHLVEIKAFTIRQISSLSNIQRSIVSEVTNTGNIPVNVRLSSSLILSMQKFIKDHLHYYSFDIEDIKYAAKYKIEEAKEISAQEKIRIRKEKEFRKLQFQHVSKQFVSSCFFASQTDPFVTGKRFLDD